ncbi:YitT family protein [Dactylosporangium sp. CS-047395]|uniref:YitT family protein n=1 Tax=Dactylosporangium sp. CS-047395 TaxID=3239936 RepID=UPI003D90C084
MRRWARSTHPGRHDQQRDRRSPLRRRGCRRRRDRAFLAAAGLFLLQAGGAVTGGTAGLGLLLARGTGWPFAVLYVAVTLPFVALAIARKGWRFAVRSGIAVALLAAFSLAHPHLLTVARIDPLYAALAGNLVVGMGLLVLFRHGASLGGFNVVALVCQERLGWRAGWVQLALDGAVILLGALVAPLSTVAVSAAGAVVLNLVIALNHRPGRYLG